MALVGQLMELDCKSRESKILKLLMFSDLVILLVEVLLARFAFHKFATLCEGTMAFPPITELVIILEDNHIGWWVFLVLVCWGGFLFLRQGGCSSPHMVAYWIVLKTIQIGLAIVYYLGCSMPFWMGFEDILRNKP